MFDKTAINIGMGFMSDCKTKVNKIETIKSYKLKYIRRCIR
jgi:hypothetical protein